MNIAHGNPGIQHAILQCFGRQLALQGLLGSRPAVNAAAQAGHRHAHHAAHLCHGHAGHGKARGRLLELDVMRLLRARKLHPKHDFVGLQGGAEKSGEKFVGRQLAAVSADRAAQGHHAGRPAGRRVGVGNRAAQGAALADLLVTDTMRQLREHGRQLLDQR